MNYQVADSYRFVVVRGQIIHQALHLRELPAETHIIPDRTHVLPA